MTRLPTERARSVLRRWTDASDPVVLGEGMEGVVYEVDAERVAKIWFSRSAQALEATGLFYAALGALPFTFAVPRIDEVTEVDEHVVTIERRLEGVPLAQLVSKGCIAAADAQTVFVDVLGELAAAGPLPAARGLSVLDEAGPMFSAVSDFPDALNALAQRRLARFRTVLGAAVDELNRKATALTMRLHQIGTGRRAVVHGDMVPANILVDPAGRPTAVLDWGFLTTEGDPAFDAAVAASLFDMYGDEALATELELHRRLEKQFGYDRSALLVYRAAYSLITANAYDPEGADGHFAWCVAALNRPDVVEALLG